MLPQLTADAAMTPSGLANWASQLVAALQLWVNRENSAISAGITGAGITITNGTLTASGGDTVTVSGLTLSGSGLAYTLTGLGNPITGNPSVQLASSIGNAINSYNGLLINQTTNQAATWENGLSVQLASSNTGNKVAGYFAISAKAGSGPAWAINPLLLVNSTYNGTGQSFQVAEFDFSNNCGINFGDAVADLGPAAGYGMQVTGLGANRGTGAIALFGNLNGGGPLWNRGIVASNYSIAQATFQDWTTSTISLDIRGGHSWGLDFSNGTFSGGPIRFENSQPLFSMSYPGGAPVQIVQLNTGNNLIFGFGGGVISSEFNSHVTPLYDNTNVCGINGARWSSVWAVNGAIQTSDPSLKTDIAELPTALPILLAIQPRTFRWIDGGGGTEMLDKEVEEHATETHVRDQHRIEMVNGVATAVPETISEEVEVYDEFPVWNEDGTPHMIFVPGKPEQRDADGDLIRAAQPEQTFQATHRAPRMRKVTRQTEVRVSRPGKRTHWGFLAPDVKAAFDAIGMDFGGYVLADDGTQHLRPDQLIPVLWKAVQELAAEVAELKGGQVCRS